MTDYRAIALAWVAEPDHRPAVEAAAKHLHYNESLHLHDVDGTEPCSYCWLRAAKTVQAIERDGQRIVPAEMVAGIRADREQARKENERLREHLGRVGAIHNGCPNTRDDVTCPWCRIAELEQQVSGWSAARSIVETAVRKGYDIVGAKFDDLAKAFGLNGGEDQC